MSKIGLCGCGCGKNTSISKKSCESRGYVKGQPKKYIHGHSGRIKEHEAHFWSGVKKTESCWIWQRGTTSGYGILRVGERGAVLAHRYSMELYLKRILSDDICVLHKCDNPPCVNPDHLFLGSRKDNALDMSNKGRVQRGERHVCAILEENDVRQIKRMLANGKRVFEVRKKFSQVTYGAILAIARGKNWFWLT